MESETVDTTALSIKRTTTFIVSLLVALVSGTNHVYSVYGPQLGHRLRLSHAEQNFVGLSGDFGAYASGPLFGRFVDSTGSRLSLTISFSLLLAGYLGVKAVFDAAKDNIAPASHGTLAILILFELFTGVGSNAGYCVALNAVARSFPDRIRTTMFGILISGFAFSSFIFSVTAGAFFPGNTSGFLLLLAVGTAIPMVLGWFLIHPCPYPEDITRVNPESDYPEEPSDLIPNEASSLIKGNRSQPPAITGLALMCSADFWILFWIKSFLMGTAIMWANNIGLMTRALLLKNNPTYGEEEIVKWQTFLVSTLSIGNGVTRILIGFIADFAKHRGLRRVQFISPIAACSVVSQLVGLYVQDIRHLQYAALLVGVSYGSTIGLLPMVLIEWFGLAHVSENLGIFTLSPLVMGNIFSIAFGRIFDSHSTRNEDGVRCLEGAKCYTASLYITALGCFCAFTLSFIAVKRDTKYIYK